MEGDVDDDDEKEGLEYLHESVIDEATKRLVVAALRSAGGDRVEAAKLIPKMAAKEGRDKDFTSLQTEQLYKFMRRTIEVLVDTIPDKDIEESVINGMKEAKGDQDFEDELEEDLEDERTHQEMAELRKRKNLLGSIDPSTLLMREDKKLGASGGGVFSLFHSKS